MVHMVLCFSAAVKELHQEGDGVGIASAATRSKHLKLRLMADSGSFTVILINMQCSGKISTF